MIPTFKYFSGKCRIRKWLVNYFPLYGDIYLEPFAGLGNIFWLARNELYYQKWILNCYNTEKFFNALLNADFNNIPEKVNSKEIYNYYKNNNSLISDLIEYRISFAGKGYIGGFEGFNLTGHGNLTKKCFIKHCLTAKNLLRSVQIYSNDWKKLNYNELTKNSFVYFDPPYIKNNNYSYPQINHNELIDFLNKSVFKWAISGYDTDLYNNELKFKNKYECLRNAEIENSVKNRKIKNKECLWTNY